MKSVPWDIRRERIAILINSSTFRLVVIAPFPGYCDKADLYELLIPTEKPFGLMTGFHFFAGGSSPSSSKLSESSFPGFIWFDDWGMAKTFAAAGWGGKTRAAGW